jgi:hypothetical protein
MTRVAVGAPIAELGTRRPAPEERRRRRAEDSFLRSGWLAGRDAMRRFSTPSRAKDADGRASASESDRRLRYGGPWFSTASCLVYGEGSRLRRMASFLARGARRPWRVAALIGLILRTRPEYVLLSGSAAGRALRAHFNQRHLALVPRNRLCRGVLILPQQHGQYLRGRRRQAVRTNLRSAASAGIRCEITDDPATALDALCEVLSRRDPEFADRMVRLLRAKLARSELTLTVARDERGHALAIKGAVIDDTVCLIEFALASDHKARWALHDHLVRDLIARGVRYLLAEGGGPFGALALPASVQHYQHLLGYELRHVIPATACPTTRTRRVLAALAAVAATGSVIALGANWP